MRVSHREARSGFAMLTAPTSAPIIHDCNPSSADGKRLRGSVDRSAGVFPSPRFFA
jgi:hypothetical protein